MVPRLNHQTRWRTTRWVACTGIEIDHNTDFRSMTATLWLQHSHFNTLIPTLSLQHSDFNSDFNSLTSTLSLQHSHFNSRDFNTLISTLLQLFHFNTLTSTLKLQPSNSNSLTYPEGLGRAVTELRCSSSSHIQPPFVKWLPVTASYWSMFVCVLEV